MKKRIIVTILATVLVFSLVGCNKSKDKDSESIQTAETSTEEDEQTEEILSEKPSDENSSEEIKETQTAETTEDVVAETFHFYQEKERLLYEDKTSKIFDEKGLFVEIFPNEGFASFIERYEDGTEGRTVYIYDIEADIFEMYIFDDSLNKGKYYYYDMAENELIRITDNDHNDINNEIEAKGQWGQEEGFAKQELEKIESYFKDNYKQELEEFIRENVTYGN